MSTASSPRDLVHAYALAVDQRSLDEAAALFAPSARLVLPEVPHHLGPRRAHEGRTAVRSALEAVTACVRTLHVIAAHVSTVDGTSGTGRTSGLAHHLLPGDDGLEDWVWTVSYADRYTRLDGGWSFAEREVTVEWIEVRPVRLHRERSTGPTPPKRLPR